MLTFRCCRQAELVVFFAHAGEKEDGVVDREAEGDREDAGGADGVDIAVAAERIAGGDLADQGDDADRGGDRGEVEGERQRGEERRPEDHEEHDEGNNNDRTDYERQAGAGRRAVIVEDGGAAAYAGQQVAFAREARGFGVEQGAGGARAGGVEGIGGDDEQAGGLAAAPDTDGLAGEGTGNRRGAVEGGEDEVAGVKEMRRAAAQGGDAASEGSRRRR